MGKFIDLSGRRFSSLEVVSRIENRNRTHWYCLCDCGGFTIASAGNLKGGLIRSCGCIRDAKTSIRSRKDYDTSSRLYSIWKGMRGRCHNKRNPNYPHYGGRGIAVCDEWNSFPVFSEWSLSNGYTDSLTIDRINVNGSYSPDNCRWATRKTQGRNTRRNKLSQADIPLIRIMINDGYTLSKVADLYNCGTSAIHRAYHGINWE